MTSFLEYPNVLLYSTGGVWSGSFCAFSRSLDWLSGFWCGTDLHSVLWNGRHFTPISHHTQNMPMCHLNDRLTAKQYPFLHFGSGWTKLSDPLSHWKPHFPQGTSYGVLPQSCASPWLQFLRPMNNFDELGPEVPYTPGQCHYSRYKASEGYSHDVPLYRTFATVTKLKIPLKQKLSSHLQSWVHLWIGNLHNTEVQAKVPASIWLYLLGWRIRMYPVLTVHPQRQLVKYTCKQGWQKQSCANSTVATTNCM